MKKMLKPNQSHSAVVTERQRIEYDRFGPWTYPVKRPEEMPPHFDPWYEELKGSTLILKLPRPLERRKFKPGSDFYEAILAVGRVGIVYLRLSQDEVLRKDIGFEDIAAVRLSEELLHGRLSFDLVDGTVISLDFNTVSSDVFDDFIDVVLRGCAGVASHRFAPVERGPEPLGENMLFQNLLHELRGRDANLLLMAYQAPCRLESKKSARRGLIGLAASFITWRLDGYLLTGSPSELIVIIRGSGAPRIGKFKGYRYETIYLPAGPFRGATVETRVLVNGALIHVLRLSSAGHDYELLFETDPSYVLSSL